MIKNLILSTAYLPPIEYWVAILQHDNIMIEAHENYQKQSYRNRCQILGPNGVQSLSIPIAKSGNLKTPILDVQIQDDDLWQKNHWKSIETAYNSSPFFLYYVDYFEDFYKSCPTSLFEFNYKLLEIVFDILELDQKLGITEAYIKAYSEATDLRNEIHPKKEMKTSKQIATSSYIQVFSERNGFTPNLSILDLIFNLGPEAEAYLSGFARQ